MQLDFPSLANTKMNHIFSSFFLFYYDKLQSLTDCSFKRQIFGTRVKLSFQLTPMANQSYPCDSLMCGVKLSWDHHSLRFGWFFILAKIWLLCSSTTAQSFLKSKFWTFLIKTPLLGLRKLERSVSFHFEQFFIFENFDPKNGFWPFSETQTSSMANGFKLIHNL